MVILAASNTTLSSESYMGWIICRGCRSASGISPVKLDRSRYHAQRSKKTFATIRSHEEPF